MKWEVNMTGEKGYAIIKKKNAWLIQKNVALF